MARRTPGARLRGRAVGVAIATALALTPLAQAAQASPGSAPAPVERAATTTGDLTMVQANIYTGLSVPRFQRDVRTVLGLAPDFVTYNEVPFRSDAVIAPAGYDMFRDPRNRFTMATPVAWRSDRWTAIDQGTFRVSNWRGKPPGRVVELGRRFANWVTLQGVDGRVLSVVSAHVAPLVNGMPDLVRPSVANLGRLVDRLSPRGPVLVGGDFNVHYRSGRYPRDLLTQHSLVPTFDTLGAYFPTGDHQGATIDFVFNRGADELAAVAQRPVELLSDHDAVVADFAWTGDAPTQTTTVGNVVDGTHVERRAVLRSLDRRVAAAQPGSVVAVATPHLELPRLRRALADAVARGVAVRVRVVADALGEVEQRLAAQMTSLGSTDSWVRLCQSTCRTAWREGTRSASVLLVGDAAERWASRTEIDQPLTSRVVSQTTHARTGVGPVALEEATDLWASLS